jgi:hypothetical protein
MVKIATSLGRRLLAGRKLDASDRHLSHPSNLVACRRDNVTAGAVGGSEYFHLICPSCSMMRPTRANKPNGHLLGSYRIATAPEANSNRLTSLKSTGFDSPANNVGP